MTMIPEARPHPTAHELARMLLDGPDLKVGFHAPRNRAVCWMSMTPIQAAVTTKEPGKLEPVVMIMLARAE